jgi:hypothetical protein
MCQPKSKPQGFDFEKNENDFFRFSCALKTQEGFLEAPSSKILAKTEQRNTLAKLAER